MQKSKALVRAKTEVSDSMFKEMLAKDQMLRANGLQHTETKRISHSFRKVQAAAIRQDNMQLTFNSTGYGLAQGFRLIILAVSVYFATRGYIEIGSVVLFLSLLDITITSTQRVLDMSPQITQGIDSLASIHELLSEDSMEKNSYRHLVAVVLQTPVLFASTLWDNLTFGQLYGHHIGASAEYD